VLSGAWGFGRFLATSTARSDALVNDCFKAECLGSLSMVPCHRAAHGHVLALHVHAMHYGITFMVNTLMLVGCVVSAQCGAGGFFVFSLQDRRSDHCESGLRPCATMQWGLALCLQGRVRCACRAALSRFLLAPCVHAMNHGTSAERVG
jgi:hypothetical protein